MNCECIVCGKPLHRKPYQLKRNKNITCSTDCLNKLKEEIYKGKGNHQYGLKGELNSSFKTGKRISSYGYVLVLTSTHPFSYDGYYPEHRIIAEENLLFNEDDIIIINGKKYLKPERVVHHIDFNKINNDPNNLFIFKNDSMHIMYHNYYKKYKYSLDEFFEHYNTYLHNLYENKEWLYDMYINKKYSINKISKITKTSWHTVNIKLIENKIKKRRINMSRNLQVKIKYFNKNIEKINKINIGDWIDLRAADNLELKAGEFKLIPLGIAMELPEGYEAHIVPRSSTFKNFGLIQTNHCGIVDESYKGDNDQWFVPMYALRNTEININDRICQFRIEKKMPEVKFIEVESLGNEDRGGHGSTGVK